MACSALFNNRRGNEQTVVATYELEEGDYAQTPPLFLMTRYHDTKIWVLLSAVQHKVSRRKIWKKNYNADTALLIVFWFHICALSKMFQWE